MSARYTAQRSAGELDSRRELQKCHSARLYEIIPLAKAEMVLEFER